MEETKQPAESTSPNTPPERGRAWRIVAIVLTIHAAVLGSAVLYQGCSKSETPSVTENSSTKPTDSSIPASGVAASSHDSAQASLPGSEVLTPEEHVASQSAGTIPTPLDQSLAPSILDETMPSSPLAAEKSGVTAPAVEKSTASAGSNAKSVAAKAKDSASSNYVVKSGDTLAKIARSKSVSVNALMAANKLTANSALKVGQKLSIPVSTKTTVASVKTPAPVVKKASSKVHVVKNGESLFAIAKKYGVTAQSLMQANKLQKDSMLHVNQKLVIPAAKIAEKAPSHPASETPTAPKLEREEGVRPTASDVPMVKENLKI